MNLSITEIQQELQKGFDHLDKFVQKPCFVSPEYHTAGCEARTAMKATLAMSNEVEILKSLYKIKDTWHGILNGLLADPDYLEYRKICQMLRVRLQSQVLLRQNFPHGF